MEKWKFCIPTFLAVATTFSVFGIIYALLFHDLPAGTKEIIFTSFGIVIGKWGSIVDFFFGSSHSAEKSNDALIDAKKEEK